MRSNFGCNVVDWMATGSSARGLEQRAEARVLARAERAGDEGPNRRIWHLEQGE
jgi:hypothetical protein